MAPEQSFARWIRVAIIAFVLLFIYYLLADAFLPVTPQARVLRQVTRIAPEVSGEVVAVEVANNQSVQAGDVLFRIDPEPFRLAVQKAELALEQARRENDELDAELAAARADLSAARAAAEEASRQRKRADSLMQSGSMSSRQYDEILARYHSTTAAVASTRARIQSLEVKRGETSRDNLRLRQAKNALATAHLNLERTTIRAPRAGWISNLQLAEGDYVKAGAPALAEIGARLDIVADFREKSLRHVSEGGPAWIALDGLPGQVFPAHLASRDEGVKAGQLIADGNLTSIPTTNRWVRDAQRIRVHLTLDRALPKLPASGARATVQLAPESNPLAGVIAQGQITLMSWLHYVY